MRTHEQHPAAGNRASESSEVAATDFMGELTLLADQFTAAADEFHRNHGLHATDSAALHLLSRSSMTMGELASGLRLTPAAVTSVVDRLESAGLAERRPDDGVIDSTWVVYLDGSLRDGPAASTARRGFGFAAYDEQGNLTASAYGVPLGW